MRLFDLHSRQPIPPSRSARSTAGRRPTRGCTRTPSPTRLHQTQRGLRGVARTKLTFNSDRDGERMSGTDREPLGQGNLHRRLRRREPAARHGWPIAEHHVRPGRPTRARSPIRRTGAACRTSSSRTSIKGTLEELTKERGQQFHAVMVAGWHAPGVRVDPRRQHGAVRRSTATARTCGG